VFANVAVEKERPMKKEGGLGGKRSAPAKKTGKKR
jgi:hypothetical protein